MRFEAKHKYFKRIAAAVRNFRNVALSLASRHQFMQCWQFSAASLLYCEGTLYDCTEIMLEELPQNLQGKLNDCIHDSEQGDEIISFWKSKSVTVEAVSYSVGDVVIIDNVHEEEVPVFGKAKYMS